MAVVQLRSWPSISFGHARRSGRIMVVDRAGSRPSIDVDHARDFEPIDTM
jgi:hypothetical protein